MKQSEVWKYRRCSLTIPRFQITQTSFLRYRHIKHELNFSHDEGGRIDMPIKSVV